MATDYVDYDDIPHEARDTLDEIFTPDGTEIWWNSRNALLADVSARQMWNTGGAGQRRVLALLAQIADGNCS